VTAHAYVGRLRSTFTQPGPVSQLPDVFIIEDDTALIELLEYGLSSRGYTSRVLRNGRDALETLRTLAVGDAHPLLLLDVDLPGLDGHSLFYMLQRERPGVFRVVFMTVHGGEDEQLRALEGGATDYLVKPVSLRVALEKIRRWVGR
jgi:DNA-binding response OmpR family regulator